MPVGPHGFRPAAARQAFETEYQRLYGHVQPEGRIVCAGLRVAARAPTGTPRVAWSEPGASTEIASAESRPVWHDGHG